MTVASITMLLVPIFMAGTFMWLLYLAWMKLRPGKVDPAVAAHRKASALRLACWTVACAYLLGVPAMAYAMSEFPKYGMEWECEVGAEDQGHVAVVVLAEWETSWMPMQDSEWQPPSAAWVRLPGAPPVTDIFIGGHPLRSPTAQTPNYRPDIVAALTRSGVPDVDAVSTLIADGAEALLTAGWQGFDDHVSGNTSMYGVAPAPPGAWRIVSTNQFMIPTARASVARVMYALIAVIWLGGMVFIVTRKAPARPLASDTESAPAA